MFSAFLTFCEGNPPVIKGFLSQGAGNAKPGVMLGLRLASDRCRYFVMTSLIGWVQAYNKPWKL